MMLFFPSTASLQRVLAASCSGDVSQHPARAATDNQGGIWIEPARSLPRAARTQLEALGVTVQARGPLAQATAVCCWHELVPLVPDRSSEIAADTRFLFVVASTRLPGLIGELRRLGGHGCGWRWFADDTAGVRVTAPSLVTLLRAGEAGGNGLRAYREWQPGVWVEAGYRHPLAGCMRVPSGQLLLIRAPRAWQVLPDEPFEEAAAASLLTIAAVACSWRETAIRARIPVTLRLKRHSSREQPELWLLSRSRLQSLLDRSDDRMLSRLAYAIVEHAGGDLVVLRRLAQRGPHAVDVLDGLAFAAYGRLPNLFVPCGTRLQPALRRDVVRQLLAADPEQVTWLWPAGDGSFTPHALAASAFRPLHEWVDYQAPATIRLAALEGLASFAFRPFVVVEEDVPRGAAPPVARARTGRAPAPVEADEPPAPSAAHEPAADEATHTDEVRELAALEESSAVELQQRLAEVQKVFLDLQTPPEAPERQVLWREMAGLHAALGHVGDAALAWAYALWEQDAAADVAGWLRSAAPAQLDAITMETPSASGLRDLVAHLHHAAHTQQRLEPARLHELQRLVEKNEEALPVRLAWLAHVALFRLAGQDVLALARARDRALERLFRHGLRLELDLPSFLRFAGAIGQERLLAVRAHLVELRKLAQAWLARHPRSPCTPLYADLTFAYGLARLGDAIESEKLLNETARLTSADGLHRWLHAAYSYRVRQVLKGEATGLTLPAFLLEQLEALAADLRYKGDRLRQFSRVLEPRAKVDARLRWHQFSPDEIERELAAVAALTDPAELWQGLGALLEDKKRAYRPYRGIILARALELAPRVGEEFARHVLARVLPGLADLRDAIEAQVLILEKGLTLAAHYDQGPYLLSFVERFQQLLAAGLPAIQVLEPLLAQLFQGLRKFGMRELIGQLLEQLTSLFLSGADLKQQRQRLARQAGQGLLKEQLAAWKALIHVAGGWLSFGEEARALAILDETRALLFQAVLHPLEQTQLACAYAQALGQLDVEPAVRRCHDLFHQIERIEAIGTTDSHVSLAQLSLIEAVVLTLASEEFSLDQRGRHWLEDDEYQVRRRIHRDLRAVMEADK